MSSYLPSKLDLTVYENSTWVENLVLHTGDATSAVQNLTGYTATLTVKAHAGDTTNLLALTSSSGITLGGSAGTITITQSKATVDAYTWTSGEYELAITDSAGVTSILLFGNVQVVTF